MKPKPLPPVEYLRRVLSYERRTGEFRWRERPVEAFEGGKSGKRDPEHACRLWNKQRAGKIAGGLKAAGSYWQIDLEGDLHLAHRIAWKMVTGEDPPGRIEHKNLDLSDNRWRNLELADKAISRKARAKEMLRERDESRRRLLLSDNPARSGDRVELLARVIARGCQDVPEAGKMLSRMLGRVLVDEFARHDTENTTERVNEMVVARNAFADGIQEGENPHAMAYAKAFFQEYPLQPRVKGVNRTEEGDET